MRLTGRKHIELKFYDFAFRPQGVSWRHRTLNGLRRGHGQQHARFAEGSGDVLLAVFHLFKQLVSPFVIPAGRSTTVKL